MLFREVNVVRDMATQVTRYVPVHEIIALQVAFGPDSVSILNRWKLTGQPYLPEAEERARLARVYGSEVSEEAYPYNKPLYRTVPKWAASASWVVNAFTPKQTRGVADLSAADFKPEDPVEQRRLNAGALAAINEVLPPE